MTTLNNPLNGIVRILKADGATAGTGFFAGNSPNIVTCAHVIRYADAEPEGTVRFVLHSDPEKHIYTARVLTEGWRPPEAEDIAFLLLENNGQGPDLFKWSTPVSLGTSSYTQGRTLSTFGYPSTTPLEGQNGSCLVIGRTRVNGVEVLQMRSQEISYGFSGAPVWDPASNFVVGMVVGIIPDSADIARPHQETAFITPIEVIRRVKPQLALEDTCPYRGFEFFDVEHKDLYFGRDEAIREMIDGLNENHLVAIVGVSGSGKSSLVRAGLARGLDRWQYPDLVNRQVCIFKPSASPFLNLLVALCSLEGRTYADVESDFHLPPKSIENADTSGVREVLSQQTTSEIADLLREHCRNKNLLLIADQFERLFTECSDRNIQNRIIEILLQAASSEVKVLIVLRVDFYKTALEHNGLAQAIKRSEVKLLSMNDRELIDTIVEPASKMGRECVPELVNSLVTDIRGRAGDLPLLQFTLKELWETDAASGVLTKESYEKLGYVGTNEVVTGVRGAIIKRAEEIWSRLQKERKDKTTERIFTSLVLAAQPTVADEDLKALDTSRRARLAEFDDGTREVISELTASFLLTTSMDPFTGVSVVEVSHEALITNWPRLQNWVRSRRAYLNWYAQKLGPYLQRWQDEESPAKRRKLLLPESMLPESHQWLTQYPDLLVGPPATYVKSSITKQKWKRIYQVIGLTVLVAVFAAIIYLLLIRNISTAEEFHERGVRALLEHDYQQAQLLLAESLNWSDSVETRHHLLEARSNGALGMHTTSPPGEVLEMTPDGHWLAFVSDQKAKLWDKSRGVEMSTTFPINEIRRVRVALSVDGKLMAFGDDSGNIRLWDFTSNQELKERPPESRKVDNTAVSAIDSIAISPNGRIIAYGNMDGVIALWSRDSPLKLPRSEKGHGETAIHCLGFSPDGTTLVSGGADASLIVWNITYDGLEQKSKLAGHEDFITSVAFSLAVPGATRQIASGSADGSVRVWNLDGEDEKTKEGKPAYLLIGHLGRVNAVAFSPDNSLIVSGSEDQTVRVWSTSVRKEILMLSTYGQAITAVAFSSDGSSIISGSHFSDDSNTSVRQWRINRRVEATTLYDTSQVTAVAFHPYNNQLIFGGLAGPIKIFDFQNSTVKSLWPPSEEPPITEGLDALAFRESDGMLAAGTYDGSIQLWRAHDLKPERSFKIEKAVWGIAFHPTAPLIAVGGQDKKIHLWDIRDGALFREIDHENVSVWNIAFTSDGQLMASGGGDGKIRIWTTSDFTLKSTFLPPNSDELWGVPFDRSNQRIITAGLDRKVRVWSLEQILAQKSKEPLIQFPDHAGIIQSVAVSPDGEWVASAGSDHTVGLWNLRTKDGMRLQLHDRPVWWVAFNRDGKFFASGGLDNRIRIVSMNAIAHIRNAAPKKLLEEAQKETCLKLNDREVNYSPCIP
jgi:WD40 repeat protein